MLLLTLVGLGTVAAAPAPTMSPRMKALIAKMPELKKASLNICKQEQLQVEDNLSSSQEAHLLGAYQTSLETLNKDFTRKLDKTAKSLGLIYSSGWASFQEYRDPDSDVEYLVQSSIYSDPMPKYVHLCIFVVQRV